MRAPVPVAVIAALLAGGPLLGAGSARAAAAAAGDKAKAKAKPPAAAGDKHASAVAHFEKGKKLGEVGRYEEAIPEFEEAYLLEPIPEILLNIALSHRFLKHLGEAVSFYDRFLRLKPDAPNRKEVEAIIKELEKEIAAAKKVGPRVDPTALARVVVTSDPPGARVRAGTKELGTTPLKVELPPGSLILRLELAGHEPKEVGVMAEPGRDALVAATLTPIPKKTLGDGGGTVTVRPPPTGWMMVTTNLTGAEILIDGALVGTAPMKEKLPRLPGRYRLSIAAPAFETATMDVMVEPGKTATPDLRVRPTNPEAGDLFLEKTEKFLASGLTIEGYWRKRKGEGELTWGGTLFGLGASGGVASVLVFRAGVKDSKPETYLTASGTLFLVALPLVIIGGSLMITGGLKLSSLKRHRWIRATEAAATGVLVSW